MPKPSAFPLSYKSLDTHTHKTIFHEIAHSLWTFLSWFVDFSYGVNGGVNYKLISSLSLPHNSSLYLVSLISPFSLPVHSGEWLKVARNRCAPAVGQGNGIQLPDDLAQTRNPLTPQDLPYQLPLTYTVSDAIILLQRVCWESGFKGPAL